MHYLVVAQINGRKVRGSISHQRSVTPRKSPQ